MAGVERQAEVAANQLSEQTRLDLAGHLEVHLETTLERRDVQADPPGAQEYHATFAVSWLEDDHESDQAALGELARASEVDSDQEVIRVRVGYGHLLVVDLHEPNLYCALDSRESDLEYLGALLFGSGKVDPDLEDELQGFGCSAVLVNHVTVKPAWRGMRLGLIGTGLALRELGRGCSFAALDAMEPGAEGEARAASYERLVDYWGYLGFRSWRERVLVLDLALRTFDDAFAQIEADLSRSN